MVSNRFESMSPRQSLTGTNVGSKYAPVPAYGHDKLRLKGIKITPQGALSADATNNRTITVYAADGTTAIATVSNSATAFAAGTKREVAFGANGKGTNLEFVAGNTIKSTDTVAGTGGDLEYYLSYEWESIRSQ